MSLEIKLSRAAAKRLQRSSRTKAARFVRKLREIAEDPLLKSSEPIAGALDAARRVRVGGWRIVYRWSGRTLFVDAIQSRGQVYRELRR